MIEKKDDYWFIRVRDPEEFKEFRTPEWAKKVTESISKNSMAIYALSKIDGRWKLQALRITVAYHDKDKALELSKRMIEKLNREKIIINVNPIFENKDYYCSENSAATLLHYFGSREKPTDLHERGCMDFDTIRKCIPKKYSRIKGTIGMIKNSIDKNNPVLVSVIPNGQSERHTFLIYGYSNVTLLTIDNGKKKRITAVEFRKIWKKTNNDSYLVK